jgi:hypothetical protein
VSPEIWPVAFNVRHRTVTRNIHGIRGDTRKLAGSARRAELSDSIYFLQTLPELCERRLLLELLNPVALKRI